MIQPPSVLGTVMAAAILLPRWRARRLPSAPSAAPPWAASSHWGGAPSSAGGAGRGWRGYSYRSELTDSSRRAPGGTLGVMVRVVVAADRRCTACGHVCALDHWRRGRCPRCNIYWWRHGVERPLGPPPPGPCQTCGRPSQPRIRSRCNACYLYWCRTGRERPPRLWSPW
jgi:hypothetical protein